MKIQLDTNNKKILLKNTLAKKNYQVMMEWEKPYMETLVRRLNPKGDVLEIGFGLGYSANEIQKHNIKSHTIIEDNKGVLKRLKTWSKKQKHKVNIIEGTWQNQLKNLGQFDSIFFDDSPNPKHPDYNDTRIFDFYYDILENHVNKNCKFVFYLDNEFVYWPVTTVVDWSIKEYKIHIPDNCEYVPNKNKSKMYLPLITFIKGRKKIPRVKIEKFDIEDLTKYG
tara:strand:+ start:319 stop:990 length:672 start_codon:yes stop_codon:yes gene_type:complete